MTEPYKLSPIHRWHVSHGAQFRTIAGWKEVDHYGDAKGEIASALDAVGICDRSMLTKIDIQGRNGEALVEHELGMRVPPANSWSSAPIAGSGAGVEPLRVLRLHSERALLLDDPTLREKDLKQLSEAARRYPCAHVTDLTSVYAAVRVVGPKSVNLLSKLCPASLGERAFGSGSCTQAPLAKVVSIVVRADIASIMAFYVLTSRDYGEYVWKCMISAGQEYRIRAFGIAAEMQLSGKEKGNVATI